MQLLNVLRRLKVIFRSPFQFRSFLILRRLKAGEGAEVPPGVPQIVNQSVPLEQLLGTVQELLFTIEGSSPSSPRSAGNPTVASQTIRTFF